MSAKDQIKQIVDYFKREPQLKDKTDGMAEGLMLGAQLADDANELSKETDASFKALQREYTENGNGSQTTAEITVARDGELVLDDRLKRDFGNVNAQLAQIVNVKSFGAVGDGITDDSVAIQAALDHIKEIGGGILVFPYATYLAAKRLKIPSNTRIYCFGTIKKAVDPAREIFRTYNGFDGDGFGGYDANENIVIECMNIDGNNQDVSGISIGHARNVVIRNVHGVGVGLHLVDLSGVDHARVENCTNDSEAVTNANSSAIQIDQAVIGAIGGINADDTPCRNIDIISNIIKNSQASTGSIQIHRGTIDKPHENINFEGNEMENVRYGIIKDTNTFAKNIKLKRNKVNGCMTGIRLQGSLDGLWIDDNDIEDASDRGIEVRGTANQLVKNVFANGNLIKDFINHGMSFNFIESFNVASNIVDKKNGNTLTSRGLTFADSRLGIIETNIVTGADANLTSGIHLQESVEGITDDIIMNENIVKKADLNYRLVEGERNIMIAHNEGRKTKNNGLAVLGELYPGASTTVTIEHGCGTYPAPPKLKDIYITPASSMGDATEFWVSSIDGPTFTISIDQPHNVAGGIKFAWKVDVI